MNDNQFTLRPSAAAYEALRAEYLSHLVSPMDDMWDAFADASTPYALCVDESVVGCCCVDEQKRLLRFYVQPPHQHQSGALLQTTLRELDVKEMVAYTLDPHYLSDALDIGTKVETHTLLFAQAASPTAAPLDDLRIADLNDHKRIVDFQEEQLGAPRAFLEGYTRERIERHEMLLFEHGAGLLCVGELRRDRHRPNISHLGLVVHSQERGRGVGTRMLCTLAQRSHAERLQPYCSTERSNTGARIAIERAGFRAHHRILNVS